MYCSLCKWKIDDGNIISKNFSINKNDNEKDY